MLIDLTGHLWNRDWIPPKMWESIAWKAAKKYWPERNPEDMARRAGQGRMDSTGETHYKDMETLGIDVMNILPLDYGFMWDEESAVSIEEINRVTCEVARNSNGKLTAFCGVDPRRPGAADLFKKTVAEWGAKGLELYTTAGYYPDDPRCTPMYKLAMEYDVPVCFQTGQGGLRYLKYGDPIHLDELAENNRDLTIIMEHSGGNLYSNMVWTAIDVAANKRNVYLDTTEYFPDAITDKEYFFRVLNIMIKRVGAHRILFGTHYPDLPLRHYIDWCELWNNIEDVGKDYNCIISPEQADLMRFGNAKRLLKLK